MNEPDPVEVLKELSTKPFFYHFRNNSEADKHIKLNPKGISSNGGITLAIIETGIYFHVGVAFCSIRDTFNKKRGREISLGRAYKEMAGLPFHEKAVLELEKPMFSFKKNENEDPQKKDIRDYVVGLIETENPRWADTPTKNLLIKPVAAAKQLQEFV